MSIAHLITHLQTLCEESHVSDLLIEDVIDMILWFDADPLEVLRKGDHTIHVRLRLSSLIHEFSLTTRHEQPDYFDITRSFA